MKTFQVTLAFCMPFLFICAQSGEGQSDTSKRAPIQIERSVRAKMRDGVSLVADIYRPGGSDSHPVLLVRTPYDRAGEQETCRTAAERDYVCVAQDVRGRYGSEGDWYPFKNEPNDGYDTVEWAAALPPSNGKVVMYGESYVGATEWLAAIARPPHLVAIQPSLTASDYHNGWVYQGGSLELWFDQSWTSILALDTLQRSGARNAPTREWLRRLPESDFPVLQLENPHDLTPYYFDWLTHPDYDEYWKKLSIEDHYELPVAAHHVGGWYDVFLRGTLRNYVGMRAHAATQWARDHQKLTIGPWIHDGPMDGKAGEVNFGSGSALDENALVLAWHDSILNQPQETPTKRVRIFVMGINQWREEEDWPLARTVYTRFYLSSAGHANSSAGDGRLSTRTSAHSPSDSFIYDPANPVPTRGGGLCCSDDQATTQQPSGAFDQSEIEKRGDVLVYTTDAFEKDFEVTGPLTAELYVGSSAPDTDITTKLVDIWPNGFAQNLADSIQRLRYRNSPEKSDFLKPGEIYKVSVEIGATSNVFRSGHRLRLEISSSNFPHFDRNLNTEESPERGEKFVTATNRIYHDLQHPSAIILPVIPAQ